MASDLCRRLIRDNRRNAGYARCRAEQLTSGGDELGPGREAECVLLRNPLLSSLRSMGPHSTKNDTRGALT